MNIDKHCDWGANVANTATASSRKRIQGQSKAYYVNLWSFLQHISSRASQKPLLLLLTVLFIKHVMSKSNLETNTGHRFISKAKTAYKIHIHTPDDKVLHRSVGFVRLGEKKGLKKAILLRNELGSAMWGKFWRRILKDPYLMTRLPHSLEPKIIHKPRPTLVLHGGFSDENGHYDVGDFMQHDGQICHSPSTPQDQDCLCLTVLTEPMVFTQGVARIFNLFGKGLYP